MGSIDVRLRRGGDSRDACSVRVVHVGPDPRNGGGMSAVIRDLLASPLGARYALDVIPTWRGFASWERAVTFAVGLAQLVAWCIRPGPRLVHVHTAVRGSLYRKSVCIVAAKATGRRVIVQLHAGPGDIEEFSRRLGPLRRRWFRAALGHADRVLSVSRAGGAVIERHFGVRDLAVVPNPAPVVPSHLSRPSADGVVRILYIGGFADPAKGGAVLVEALGDLLAALPDARITLAGPGEAPAALRDRIRTAFNVSWHGWLDAEHKQDAFARCDVFVMPSVSEALPVALLEAMAWGVAIVASCVGAIPDVVGDDAAVLVEPGDPGALAAAIVALAGDPERRRALAEAARRRAAGMSDHEVAAQLEVIYRELLA